MRDAVSHHPARHVTVGNIDVMIGYDPTTAIDEFLDAGGSFFDPPAREFPLEWLKEVVSNTKTFFQKSYNTELRAAELGISRKYERMHYSPSWNAKLFPEVDILAACGVLKRGKEAKKAAKRAGKVAQTQAGQTVKNNVANNSTAAVA